ncbi:hypothetical protein [Roseateles toxinivorans]|uniref:Uncharacterized protein n=1 Tax=Roseateles toxinivorans TaxID=270368 RepID=A0A4R6QFC4_9BURK|nr:hypothetical protein [Roseateles toxinivorans]TDP61469.1 hypothetical protein DES47_11218 [Roseateles toxinivorans]
MKNPAICHRLACVLLALSALSAQAREEALILDAGFKPAELAGTLMKSSTDAREVRGLKRVAITGFDVEFVTKGAASASATEIGRSGSASTSVYVTLVGVAEPDFQAIVDQLYAEFVRDVQASGIEVVPAAQLMASGTYRKMAAGGSPAPHKKSGGGEWSTVFTPEGRPVMGLSLQSKGVLGAFGGLASMSGAIFDNIELQKELDATLLTVRMVVKFVDLASSSSSFLGRISGTASVTGKVSPTIAAGATQMSLQSALGGAQFGLQRPLQIDAAAIPEIKDVSSVAGNIGLAVLSLAIGKGGSATAVEKEAVADPVRYRELVSAGLGNVRELMVERIKGVR